MEQEGCDLEFHRDAIDFIASGRGGVLQLSGKPRNDGKHIGVVLSREREGAPLDVLIINLLDLENEFRGSRIVADITDPVRTIMVGQIPAEWDDCDSILNAAYIAVGALSGEFFVKSVFYSMLYNFGIIPHTDDNAWFSLYPFGIPVESDFSGLWNLLVTEVSREQILSPKVITLAVIPVDLAVYNPESVLSSIIFASNSYSDGIDFIRVTISMLHNLEILRETRNNAQLDAYPFAAPPDKNLR